MHAPYASPLSGSLPTELGQPCPGVILLPFTQITVTVTVTVTCTEKETERHSKARRMLRARRRGARRDRRNTERASSSSSTDLETAQAPHWRANWVAESVRNSLIQWLAFFPLPASPPPSLLAGVAKLGEDAAGACAGWCLPFRVRNDGDHPDGIADMDASKMPMLACVSCCCCCFLLVRAIALGPSPAMLAWGWKLERAQPACTSNARAAGQLQRVPAAAAAAAQRLISLYTRLCMRRHNCCCHLDAEVAGLTRFSSRFIQLLARRCARIAASQGV